ncbi:MAG TPA: glycosyltransferase [Anaerolineales bacterium]|nr:glycosyltransferase [Anaerolineae bacterium]HIQ01646.1 glycosyltransferase [Anaerolineales bacterium]
MRIGLLTDGYKPGTNGVIRFISLHKRTLERLGHEVFIFTWGEEVPEDEPGVIRSPGIPFVRPGYHVAPGYSHQARALLQTMDVLHANQPLLSGALALRYGRRYGLPVVLTCHSRYDLLGVTRLPFLPLPLYREILRPTLRRISDRYDVVMAPSPEAARVMRSLGVRRPIEVVPYGVDLDGCRHPPKRLRREELGLPADVPLALFLGRLEREKDVSFLLEALARPEPARTHLLLVGDGVERERLEADVRGMGLMDRVRFVGEVPAEEVPAYIALADLFVTASRIEMLPVAVIEAMAGGLPVVGLDVPWIRPVVRSGVNGLLAEPEVASFARAWARLATDEPLRARLSEGARTASERYDLRRTTAQMIALYERLLEERRG